MFRAKRARCDEGLLGSLTAKLAHPFRSSKLEATCVGGERPVYRIPRVASLSDHVPTFTKMTNFCDARLGAHVIFATDEYRCSASDILQHDRHPPSTRGWITRRRRIPGHEWCLIKLPVPIIVRGILITTGNDAPPHISIEGAWDVINLTGQRASKLIDTQSAWRSVVGVSPLKRNQSNYFEVTPEDVCGQDLKIDVLLVNLLPDGGIQKLWVYGECALDLGGVFKMKERELPSRLLNYADGAIGAQVVYASSGWETAANLLVNGSLIDDNPQADRRDSQVIHPVMAIQPVNDQVWITPRQPLRPMFVKEPLVGEDIPFSGEDQVIIALAARCLVHSVDVSTTGIHGDLPYKVFVSVLDSSQTRKMTVLQQQLLFANHHARLEWFEFGTIDDLEGDEEYTVTLKNPVPATHLKIAINPDGAVARVCVSGKHLDFDAADLFTLEEEPEEEYQEDHDESSMLQ
ncbi:putative allantoicase [Gregarina niphandrodes]|uniref:Allantoicase n=1 Tax=Gregarina niphandrodes TaxID=110365 RepID=A0A023B9I1_GRENI|nr:putative allantoicase [Gregarina niphandrodes]EZG72886.1 putative allantoicase [Gregarina niphandrodes]|eukprot:XP_011129745.1 putative allantoicase [Gregarina niphandrodes]